MSNPYQVVKDFEKALCDYTGAPYAVTVNSCTMALLLSLSYQRYINGWAEVSIPKKTYCSLPQVIKLSGHRVAFVDEEWHGAYKLAPFPIYDCARWFTSDMFNMITKFDYYSTGDLENLRYLAVSFHSTKILADIQGGAILHNNSDADKWFRKARFDGRTEGVEPKDDYFDMLGYHCMMTPDVAARLLVKLSTLPAENDPLPNSEYPDLSKYEVFR